MASSTSAEPQVANPAPLGLAGFALTTFLLSLVNAGVFKGADIWLGFALFYGGLAQLLAGMWEFRAKNTFGATAFSSYGAFWLSVAFYIWFFAPKASDPSLVHNDLNWAFLAWTIFTGYMMLNSFRIGNPAVAAVFVALFITFALLWLGEALNQPMLHTAGGWTGIITAIFAWYASYAGVSRSLA
jgi:uncharacterized protein